MKTLKIRGIGSALALMSVLTISSCDDVKKNTIEFAGAPFPSSDAQKRSILASESVRVNGTTKAISYNVLARSGDVFGGGVMGAVKNYQGVQLVDTAGEPIISNAQDFSSLIKIGGRLFNITQFETRPASMYLSLLNQKADGNLEVVWTRDIDVSEWKGLWVPCAGSVTPWNTHLGSEEYPPDYKGRNPVTGETNYYLAPTSYYTQMGAYFQTEYDNALFSLPYMNPYWYGWVPEVKIKGSNGTAAGTRVDVKKHFAMGRFAHELAFVMPDERTVYLSDDGTNVGLYMFIADRKRDLSSGRLYAAKWLQTSTEKGGQANLEWIDLGHATNRQIKKNLGLKCDKGADITACGTEDWVQFSDMFEVGALDEANGACADATFTLVHTSTTNGEIVAGKNTGAECLKLKTGSIKGVPVAVLASRLETSRYAALKGATMEFRKEEGISYDVVRRKLYVAMSEVSKGMTDDPGRYDFGGNNHIKLPQNKCGAVYELPVAAGQKDANGRRIHSRYIATRMQGIVVGDPESGTDDENSCNINGIANPDNVTFLPGSDKLVIGEDVGSGHQNDVIWTFNLTTEELVRIQTTPYGSETTSPYIYGNLDGFGYLMSVVQHPFGESDQDQLLDASEARGYIGYIGPLPPLTRK